MISAVDDTGKVLITMPDDAATWADEVLVLHVVRAYEKLPVTMSAAERVQWAALSVVKAVTPRNMRDQQREDRLIAHPMIMILLMRG